MNIINDRSLTNLKSKGRSLIFKDNDDHDDLNISEENKPYSFSFIDVNYLTAVNGVINNLQINTLNVINNSNNLQFNTKTISTKSDINSIDISTNKYFLLNNSLNQTLNIGAIIPTGNYSITFYNINSGIWTITNLVSSINTISLNNLDTLTISYIDGFGWIKN